MVLFCSNWMNCLCNFSSSSCRGLRHFVCCCFLSELERSSGVDLRSFPLGITNVVLYWVHSEKMNIVVVRLFLLVSTIHSYIRINQLTFSIQSRPTFVRGRTLHGTSTETYQSINHFKNSQKITPSFMLETRYTVDDHSQNLKDDSASDQHHTSYINITLHHFSYIDTTGRCSATRPKPQISKEREKATE